MTLTENIRAKLPGSRRVQTVPAPPTPPEPTFEPWSEADGEPVSDATAYNAGTAAFGALMAARQASALEARRAELQTEREARQKVEDEIWDRYTAGRPKVGA
jgi:hypothetical protein